MMPLMLLMGIAFGFTLGCIIHFLKVEPFIVTLMGLFFARGMAYIITLEALPIQDPIYRFLALTKLHIPFLPKEYVYIPSLVGPLLLLVAMYLSCYTRFGRTVYAIGNNEQSARLMGLPVGRTKIIVYAFSGFCSALAGIVWSISLLSGYGGYAPGMELDAIASVVIGGIAVDRRGGLGNWHSIRGLDQRHHHLDPPVQWYVEFVVDSHRRRCADLDFYRSSGPVLYKEKTYLRISSDHSLSLLVY